MFCLIRVDVTEDHISRVKHPYPLHLLLLELPDRAHIHPSEEPYAIIGLFDGEINIYEKETEKDPGKYLRIKRMSNRKYPEDELLLGKDQS